CLLILAVVLEVMLGGPLVVFGAPAHGSAHAAPLRVKAVGARSRSERTPTKPKDAELPAGIVAFQPASMAVTVLPAAVVTAPQPPMTCWPSGKVHTSRQPWIGRVPVFVIVTSARKPPGHCDGTW